MHDANRAGLLAEKLDQIEAELKRAGLWSDEESDPFAGLPPGRTLNFLSAVSFESWLQFVFLPQARQALRRDELPRSSQVGLMALRQWDYQSHLPEGQGLIRLLNEFDDLVKGHA